MSAAKILVLEDDPLVVSAFKLLLAEHELDIHACLDDFLKTSSAAPSAYDLVLLDLCHENDPEGLQSVELFPELQQRVDDTEIIIQSGLKDIGIMRKCLQMGAQKFVLKDHIADEIPVCVSHCLERKKIRQELDAQLVGNAKVMLDLKRRLLDLRQQNNSVDVLIEGETGSGKELCARALHREGPFRALNVSALPRELFEAELFGSEKGAYTGAIAARTGYLESVENGVLFLDEIQSLSLDLQAKLLRVVESRVFCRIGSTKERRFNGRFVSASNELLYDAVKKGHFREDLYFRLAATYVSVPPLRARGADILLLAKHFLAEFSEKNRLLLTEEGARYLQWAYDWPGNVRELRSLMRTLALESKMPYVDAPEIEALIRKSENNTSVFLTEKNSSSADAFSVRTDLGLDENVEIFEKYVMECALQGNSCAQAREKLKLSRSRFYEKLRQYGLQKRGDAKKSHL